MTIFEVFAHEGEESLEVVKPSLDEVIRANSLKYSLIAFGMLLGLAVLALLFKNASDKIKYLLFGVVVVVAVLTTVYLAGSTIYLNQQSQTGGPVHYHADFEIYNCGQKVEIKDPEGFSNKVGTEVVHEHNDNRIHIEGVILDEHDASLGHFVEQIGGELHEDHMAIPAEGGLLEMENGQMCGNQEGNLQVFVYHTKGDSFSQRKLIDNPQDYIISPFGQIPPGDCIIIEFGPEKEKTDKLCTFYKVAKEKGELKILDKPE
ncbi:hypothetical protein HYT18_03340 [Candidatus Microgenomates bacterium]|nr:hypothetical protein [Candidatus Microgenomates bacterium]